LCSPRGPAPWPLEFSPLGVDGKADDLADVGHHRPVVQPRLGSRPLLPRPLHPGRYGGEGWDPGREGEVPPVSQDDDLKEHTDNWLACLRSRKTPNGSIESGFAHSVAVVMATRSYREGKKLYWDREREEIVEREPVASPVR
jgi:hypothetical protein